MFFKMSNLIFIIKDIPYCCTEVYRTITTTFVQRYFLLELVNLATVSIRKQSDSSFVIEPSHP